MGGRSIGRYMIHDEIAAGGMATVHLGRLVGPIGFSRTVAIKRLHPHLAREPDVAVMFLDEARLAARIRHPNVGATLDVVDLEGELLLVLDYIHGESLSRLMRAHASPLEPRIASAILIGVLEGLHAAHEAKNERGEPLCLVHRDVSPQNVIVGVDGIARVVDFGIAKAVGRSQTTRDGQVKGKAAYMAPEQLVDAKIDRRTDVYAAGVVLWEVLTGRRLFMADDPLTTMRKVLTQKIEPPSQHVPGLGHELDRIVLRALASDPAARFGTAREMAVAIERAVPPATARDLGDWVDSIAHETLRLRAELVAHVEGAPAGPSPPSPLVRTSETATREESPPPVDIHVEHVVDHDASALSAFVTSGPRPGAWHRSVVRLALGALGVAAVVGAALVMRRQYESAPRAAPLPAAASSDASARSPALSLSASKEPEAPSPSASSPPGEPPPASSRPASLPPSAKPPHPSSKQRRVAVPPAASCAELFTWSPDGKKIPKPECF